jgi:hypothetical protein
MRWGIKGAIGGVFVAILLLTSPARQSWASFDHSEPEYCESATVRGNPAELAGLPSLHRPPETGQLPFLPETLQFWANSEFQVGEGSVGFTLWQGNGHRSDVVGLTASAAFFRVDRHGRVLDTLAKTQTHVGSVKGFETVPLFFEGATPGLYRADVTFEDGSGTRLGSYGAYFRVLPLVHHPPRLALNASVFHPGELLLARVENFSRNPVSYGVPYSIERLQGGVWEKAPESPDGPWIMPLYRGQTGSTGPCLYFRIPDTTEPGRYRMVKFIRTAAGGRRLFAQFTIGG